MKNIIFTIILISTLTFIPNFCIADIKTNEADYQIINSGNEEQIVAVKSINNLEIVKQNNKYGIFNKETNEVIFPIKADKITLFDEEKPNEFKIELGKYAGYYNSETNDNFLAECDDIQTYNNYLKIKLNGKYGLVDKKGYIILAPVFQKILIDDNHISAKSEGQYRYYEKTGRLIPENELYPIEQNSSFITIKDLSPKFKTAYEEGLLTYKKTNNKETETDKLVYEMHEIPATNIIKEEKNEQKNLFTLNKDKYYIVQVENKIGIKDANNEFIIPANYNSFDIIKPCKHYIHPLFLLKGNNSRVIYNTKGITLAEELNNKIIIKQNKKTYIFYKESGILSKNGIQIGEFIKNEENKYSYKKLKLSVFNPHKVIELILILLDAE